MTGYEEFKQILAELKYKAKKDRLETSNDTLQYLKDLFNLN